ncbi:MAG: HAD-IA family hydrolase [Bacteroidetes bacterium]|nr:HAD-IA family hydrolase [Bacteroidota bacterium]MBS1974213.1 HAD-IA family hydrolase [Bacteroidota bacterium]
MKNKARINTLFTDIGGVLLTNGWDRQAREKAIKLFDLSAEETEERHHLTFDTYEVGKLSLDEYLERVVFYKKRNFTKARFRKFMFEQSRPFPEMIALVKILKKKYNLKVAVVSNEGFEMNDYRIKTFNLNEFVDFFICSGFVHFRKPDKDIYKIALNAAQVSASQVVYLEDRPLFVQVAESMGIKGILHIDHKSTAQKFRSLLSK